MTPYATSIALYIGQLKGWNAAYRRLFYSWRRLLTGPEPRGGCPGGPTILADTADDVANGLLARLDTMTDSDIYDETVALYQRLQTMATVVREGRFCFGDPDCCWAP